MQICNASPFLGIIQEGMLNSFRNLSGNNISVCYANNSLQKFDKSLVVGDVIAQASLLPNKFPIVGAFINNELFGLGEEISVNVKKIEPLFLNSNKGMEIYKNSLCMVFAFAANYIFPNRKFSSFHSVDGAVYFKFLDDDKIKDEDYARLEDKMQEIVKAAYPILIRDVTWEEASDYFAKINCSQTVSLLEKKVEKKKVRVVVCNDYIQLFQHTPHLTNTSLLSHFSIAEYIHTASSTPTPDYGVVLKFPTATNPFVVGELPDRPVSLIYEVFKECGMCLYPHSIQCVGDLNKLIADSVNHKFSSPVTHSLTQYILLAEAAHDRQTVRIATAIASRPYCRVVCIAGPSSSAKTTFAYKLAVHLRVLGRQPVPVSLDEFYLDRAKMPRDGSTGEIDFEAPEALDLPLVNRILTDLVAMKEVTMPKFDMKKGVAGWGGMLRLHESSVIIVEGIHGLNDKLTEMVPAEQKYRVFIAPFTNLSLDDTHTLASEDTRLLRRITRDYQFRAYSAEDSIRRWPSVRRGEELYILPTQKSADALYNSSIPYELAALKVLAEPLLRNISPTSSAYAEAQRLLRLLGNFLALDHSYILPTSLLKEFIGGSPFHQQ